MQVINLGFFKLEIWPGCCHKNAIYERSLALIEAVRFQTVRDCIQNISSSHWLFQHNWFSKSVRSSFHQNTEKF